MSQTRKSGRIASRRTHRKSRLGCANCKRRRIKCDERKPACTNCVRHSIRCDFESASPSNTSTVTSPGYVLSHSAHSPLPMGPPSPHISDPASISGLNLAELELFQHYIDTTCVTMGGGPLLRSVWQITIPRLGFTNQYILQLALALSAFHLSRQQPERAAVLRNMAEQYHDSAIQTVTGLLPQLNHDNCDALYIAATFICSLSFARGPTPGEYLMISDRGVSEWLVLNRGARAILELQRDVLFSGSLSAMFHTAGRNIRTAFTDGAIPDINEDTRAFRRYLVSLAVTDPNTNTYLEAFDRLIRTLQPMLEAVEAGDRSCLTMFLLSWIYLLEENFVICLQQHQPLALVILAYFAMGVHIAGSYWIMEGWAEHIMAGICRFLPEEFMPWIRWPAEQIGYTI